MHKLPYAVGGAPTVKRISTEIETAGGDDMTADDVDVPELAEDTNGDDNDVAEEDQDITKDKMIKASVKSSAASKKRKAWIDFIKIIV